MAVIGLSMGGALALRLAATHRAVSHVVLVNPSLTMKNRLLPLLRRIPLVAVHEMTRLWADVRRRLPAVTQPIMVFRSRADGEAGLRSVAVARQGVRSTHVVEIQLARSGHVATLDWDADLIFEKTRAFLADRTAPPVTRAG